MSFSLHCLSHMYTLCTYSVCLAQFDNTGRGLFLINLFMSFSLHCLFYMYTLLFLS